MNSQPDISNPFADSPIAALYRQLLDSWNRRDASAFAALFARRRQHRVRW